MIKKIYSLLFISILTTVLLAGIALAEPATEITVSAAISLKNAFEEIGKIYESRYKSFKVVFNFGASGDLMAQIRSGAPVDVFASAALKDMDELDKDGLIENDTRTNFVANTVVLIAPSRSKIALSSFEDLKKPEVTKIAVGNPKTVPAGRYTEETFQYYKISDKINEKLVFAENVRQVLDYVARDEVDAGVVYSTDAMVRQREVLIVMTAPDDSHKPIIYPIAVIKGSKSEKAARAFISLVTSDDGGKILSTFGFRPITKAR